jgi:hypothetical protein
MDNIKNVLVVDKKTVKITADSTSGVISSSRPVTLKGNPTLTSLVQGATSLSQLSDVSATHSEISGSTLVWDDSIGKFVAKKLDITDINGSLDGGVF